MPKDIILDLGIKDCGQYGKCNGPERCPVLTSVNYIVQEHEVTHCCSLRYRVDASRRKDRPYCSFTFVAEEGQPAMDELKRELEMAIGPVCPEAAD
jgi:hypothetical protein